MIERRNSDSFDSRGNLVVALHGIRVAMGIAAVSAASYWIFTILDDRKWQEHHPGGLAGGPPDPLWKMLLWIALPLVPFILSVVLVSARSEEAIAAGAGVAAALFLCSLLFAMIAAAGFMFAFWPNYYASPTAASILICSASSAWIIVSAFRIGAKAGWGVFFLAAGGTLVGMIGAYRSLGGR